MSKSTQIGQRVPRRDGLDKVTGRAAYTSDMTLPNMLHAKVLRSPHPHARIVDIDVTEAESMDGVKAILTYKNVPDVLFNASSPMVLNMPEFGHVSDQRIFDSVVRYVGDEVAAVAAVSEDIAEAACKKIHVTYEQLPVVYDAMEAMKPDAPELHEEKNCTPEGRNIPGEIIRLNMGDIETGLQEADVVIEESFTLPVVKQVQMETQSALAQIAGDNELTVWSTTQVPHPARLILSKIFDMPASKVRVLAPPYVGGGFGVRIGLSGKAEPIAAALALKARRPVKYVYTRREDFIASDTRHGGTVTVKLGARKDGTFCVLDIQAVFNTGAYCSAGVEVPGACGTMALAAYRVPHQRYAGHSVYTNTTPAGAMRGFGNPQGNVALEQVVDMMAEKLSIDACALRQKNIIQVGDTWCLPYPCESTELAECLRAGAERIDWQEQYTGATLYDETAKVELDEIHFFPDRFPQQEKCRGIGVAVGTHVSTAWPFSVEYSNATVIIHADGTAQLASGIPEIGTGGSTALVQIVADSLGVPFNTVSMTFGDTQGTPFEVGIHASRTCYAAGFSARAAALNAQKHILEYAAPFFAMTPDDIQLIDGIVYPRSISSSQIVPCDSLENATHSAFSGVPISAVALHAHQHSKQFIGVGSVTPHNAAPWHACFAEVEVDMGTGHVDVLRIVAAHDVGAVINPALVEASIQGGVAQGVGYALGEEIEYTASGRQVQSGMRTYLTPTIKDIPPIDVIVVKAHDPTSPLGVKGVGEAGIICPASAIANAVANATGQRFTELPLTAGRVLSKLRS